MGCFMERKNLEHALAGLISELKPAPFLPENAVEHRSIELDGTEKTNSRLEWSRKAHTQITLSGDLTPLLCPPQTLNKRRQIILIGGVAPKAIVIRFDPAKNQLSNLLAFHRNAVKAINQLLFEGCKKTFHPRIVKTAMCASHALSNGSILSEQRTVFPTGVLAAVIRMKDQTGPITIAGNCMAKRITA